MFQRLRDLGILGMNRRVGQYILQYNPRSSYPVVDSKILTYKRFQELGIPMPKHFLEIENFGDLKHIKSSLRSLKTYVVKPSNGAMGNGVLIVNSVSWSDLDHDTRFVTSRNPEMTLDEFKYYLSGILSGLYSLNGLPDQIIVQEKLLLHPCFENISTKGIPDIRVLVFRGYPIMAMLRLPTLVSSGRANLHQGAVGAGVSIGKGRIAHAIFQDRIIHEHPDTLTPLRGLQVPHWDSILELAASCYEAVEMGYLGVDVVVHPTDGPMILEVNARPGLSIQTANLLGLVPRLEQVAELPKETPSVRAKVSKELFPDSEIYAENV